MMNFVRAFILGCISLVVNVRFHERKRAYVDFKMFKHPLLTRSLEFVGFDCRMAARTGTLKIDFRERDAVAVRRAMRRLKRISHKFRSSK